MSKRNHGKHFIKQPATSVYVAKSDTSMVLFPETHPLHHSHWPMPMQVTNDLIIAGKLQGFTDEEITTMLTQRASLVKVKEPIERTIERTLSSTNASQTS